MMKFAVFLIVVFLAVLIPMSHQQAGGKSRSWMPQGRFGKRTSDKSAAIRALLNSK